ncbi:MAG: carbohydrate binding family 9 domain-containing protein [Candidatus Eisenbacteria bacterium]|nr:carbohydrate binding family 9 domain-containing protein [Candidatus Eisenbacteria bacterium]
MNRWWLVVAGMLFAAGTAGAAGTADSAAVARPEVHAARLSSVIAIDGLLNEPIWSSQPAEDRFIQSDPDQAAKPSFRTEVRVLYDDDAIYVGARMFDPHPDSIVANVCRRDDGSHSDEFTIFLDPYHDRRSGYYFVVSAAGVLRDGVEYNDDWDDSSWDGVWQGRARIDSLGWTVEMRIPYSQLRFRKSDQYRWGVNFRRNIARRNESDLMVYTPRNESGFVSRFPDLVGIERIRPARAILITPYATSRGEFVQHAIGDPFHTGGRYEPQMGADLKTAVGSKLTLNATVNPDFGQVEVDPAVVNLSDVETTFDEKRPFFVEGSNSYDFGFGGASNYMGFNWPGPSLFYSRRIGRTPELSPASYDFADIPTGTRILGAAKLTGKILGEWNLGVMQALTERETAPFALGGARGRAEVEPLTSYSVLRAQREFAGGRQGFGVISTMTQRRLDDPGIDDQLNRSGSVTGFDGWTFLDKDRVWVVTGWMTRSDVAGTAARMTTLQSGSGHYLQRPDAERWRIDSTATVLTGYAGRFTVNKQKGNLQFNSAVGFINPHFDSNDLGILSRSDVINAHVSTGYRWSNPDHWKRSANVSTALFGSTDFDGNLTHPGLWMNGGVVFLNYWTFFPRFAYNPPSFDNRSTRGGPIVRSPSSFNGGFWSDTDSRKKLYYQFEYDFSRSETGSWYSGVYPTVQWKPSASILCGIGPGFERSHSDAQWVGSVDDPGATQTFGRRYVFAQFDQTTLSANIRCNWSFTPNAGIQVYVQPLISSGNYFAYKQLVRGRSYAWEPVGSGLPQYDPTTDQIDLDGAGTSYGPYNPDFNFTSLRGNAIMRWEYMPGSTLFLVWTQERSQRETLGQFDFGPSLSRMVDKKPNNIFLAKLTYYFNM